MTITATLTSDTPEHLTAAARRAEAWFGEPFLHAGDDPDAALAPGTARRAALVDALDELEKGHAQPSSRWKVRYGLMLGLERVLTEDLPARRRAPSFAGTRSTRSRACSRSSSPRRSAPPRRTATGTAAATERSPRPSSRRSQRTRLRRRLRRRGRRRGRLPRRRSRGGAPVPLPPSDGFGQDEIVAAGFVEAARHLGILILTHRRPPRLAVQP